MSYTVDLADLGLAQTMGNNTPKNTALWRFGVAVLQGVAIMLLGMWLVLGREPVPHLIISIGCSVAR